MSGIGAITGSFTPELGAIIGAGAGGFLNKVLPSSLNPKLVAGGKIALGAIIRRTSKNQFADGAGLGLVALGAVELMQQLGILSGMGASDSDMLAVSLEGADEMNGADLAVINGDLSVINGDVLAGDVLAGEDDYM
jgi:hypothetical protein